MRVTRISLIIILTVLISIVLFLAVRVNNTSFKETYYIVENSLELNKIDTFEITDALVKLNIDVQYIDLKAIDDNGYKLVEICSKEDEIYYFTFDKNNDMILWE